MYRGTGQSIHLTVTLTTREPTGLEPLKAVLIPGKD